MHSKEQELKELFGCALGHWLADGVGLRSVYVPDGVTRSTAAAIVNAANAATRSSSDRQPLSLLVADTAASLTDSTPTITASDAVQFRHNKRLLVVHGRHPELASITSSFPPVLDKSFPSDANRTGLRSLAEDALAVVLEAATIERETPASAIEILAQTFEDSRDALERLRQGSKPWNAYWFDHASTALNNLLSLLLSAKSKDPALNLERVLGVGIPAAFGLPQRGLNSSGRPVPFNATKFKDAAETAWSDQDTVGTTVLQLAHHPDTQGDSHALSTIDWQGFDQTLAIEDNVLLALAKHGRDRANVTEAFEHLTFRQFVDPWSQESLRGSLRIFEDPASVHGLSISELPETGPDLLEVYFVEPAGVTSHLESDILRIRIPTFAVIGPDDDLESNVAIKTSISGLQWAGVLEAEDGSLWAKGKFSLSIARFPAKVPARPFTLKVVVPPGDPLSSIIDHSKTRQVILAIGSVPGCWAQRLDTRGNPIGRGEYIGTERILNSQTGEDKDVSWTTEEVGSTYRFLTWGSEEGPLLSLGSTTANRFHGREMLFEFTIKVSDQDEFDIEDCHFVLRAVQNTSTNFSPIIAAIKGNRISLDDPLPEMSDSLAGKYEQLAADRVTDESWLLGLGHIVLPSDEATISVMDAAWSQEYNCLMPPKLEPYWNAVFGEELKDDLLHSQEAHEFRQAFLALDIEAPLQPYGENGPRRWPSRVSWGHLWSENRASLDRYLSAHVALMRKADQLGDSFGRLWAAYPFSISGWSSAASAQCEAIYLSPLHPVRLAWLAAVESTVSEATNPGGLTGTIEGWKFPYIGPCGTPQGFALAVPSDSGPEQIFLGWSLLVSAELQVPKALQAPYRFGQDPLPGSTASGLNATSASAALRDFQRLHPHVSTLSIDLASTVPTQRLSEMDEAVVDAVAVWGTDSSAGLVGGVRVLDSLNRLGELPRLAASKLLARESRAPFSWTRYEHVSGQTQRCNVRLLQDSGVALFAGRAQEQDGKQKGLVGRVPLRRFELQEAAGISRRTTSLPGLREEASTDPFSLCLRVLEGENVAPKITAMIHNSILVDPRADWTVSGEALINPAAMSSMVQHHGSGSQMLWEWRPPFLGVDSSLPALDRRPFISVARVPPTFRDKLSRMLSAVRGEKVSEANIDSLLGVLGARGIGLSSLLTMSENHSSGAVGFYLALRLMEHVSHPDYDDFVIPIDACDVFLRAMTGVDNPRIRDKRADLLSIRLSEDEIILTPIEIKSYGLGSQEPDPILPQPGPNAFKEPATQLLSTVRLLRLLVQRHTEACSDRDSADAAIWSNSFAALIEVGMKLTPRTSGPGDKILSRFQRVIESDYKVRLGKPVIAYYAHTALTRDGKHSGSYSNIRHANGAEQFDYGAHVVNTSAAFASIDNPESEIVTQWTSLIDWATIEQPSHVSTASPVPPETIENPEPEEEGRFAKGSETDSAQTDFSSHTRDPQEDGNRLQPEASIAGDGIRFKVGHLLHSIGDAEATFWPSNTALNQMNIGVVGDLGTGKTQLLKALVYQLRLQTPRVQEPPLSMLIFDYKRDFQDPSFLETVGGRLLRPQRIPLNLFAISGDYSRQKAFQAASRFGAVLQRIYGGIGPKQLQRLNDVVVELFEQKQKLAPTLSEVYYSYLEASATPDALSAILQSFHYNEVFTDDSSEFVTFAELIHDTILVLAVDSFGTDQNMKNSLVTLFLNMYYDFMLGSTKWPYTNTEPQLRNLNSFLLVDEAVNIMEYRFPVLQQLLLQGREYGFGVILCSQYLSHFRQGDINYGEPLLTWFIHKVPSVRTSELHHLGLTNLSDSEASKIPHLKKHQALYSSLNHPGEFIAGTPYYELLKASSTSEP